MSHGDEHRAAPGGAQIPTVMTYGAAANIGDVLAERYRLEELVDSDSAGRQIWRGVDIVLRRPIAIIVHYPGGEAARGMLTTAVAMSHLVHPHIVSVYDAIDEGERAYVVREWISGTALRDVLRQAPLDPERSTLVTHAISEAVAAIHAAGIVHGNVHPGTILIADDGRVVLADSHGATPANPETDLRAIGGVLYACLTGLWPHAEVGYATLPDAVRDASGRLAAPRQVRGGIPQHLDEIAADLLDLSIAPPPAATIAAEFARLASQGVEPEYDDADNGPIGFDVAEPVGPRRRSGGKLALGVAVLAIIATTGAFVGAKVLGGSPAPEVSTQTAAPSAPPSANAGQVIPITAEQVRIVDPPRTDRAEVRDAELTVDGDTNTGWKTDEYNAPYFGGSRQGAGLKPGMGILIDLGKPTKVGTVEVVLNQEGASVALRTGDSVPEPGEAGDAKIAKEFTTIGTPFEDHSGTVMVFPVGEEQQEVRYLLVWITKLPQNSKGRFAVAVNEITVRAP